MPAPEAASTGRGCRLDPLGPRWTRSRSPPAQLGPPGFWPLRVGGTRSESLGHPSHSVSAVVVGRARGRDAEAGATVVAGDSKSDSEGDFQSDSESRPIPSRAAAHRPGPPVPLARHLPPGRTRTSRAQASGRGQQHSAVHIMLWQRVLHQLRKRLIAPPGAIALLRSVRRVDAPRPRAVLSESLSVVVSESRRALSGAGEPPLPSRAPAGLIKYIQSVIKSVRSQPARPRARSRGGVWDRRPLPSGAQLDNCSSVLQYRTAVVGR